MSRAILPPVLLLALVTIIGSQLQSSHAAANRAAPHAKSRVGNVKQPMKRAAPIMKKARRVTSAPGTNGSVGNVKKQMNRATPVTKNASGVNTPQRKASETTSVKQLSNKRATMNVTASFPSQLLHAAVRYGTKSGNGGTTDAHTQQVLQRLREHREKQQHSPKHPSSHLYKTTIRFAANDKAAIYVNGTFHGSILNKRRTGKVTVWLCKGSVIAFVVRKGKPNKPNRMGGLVADVKFNGRHYVTGRDDFKARKSFSSVSWMRLGSKACQHWQPAKRVLKPTKNLQKSLSFPYGNGGKYVWANNAPKYGLVFVRFVIGGEICPPPTTGHSTATPSPSPTLMPDKCNCNKVYHGKTGVCYDIVGRPLWETLGSKYMGLYKCTKRDCEPTYECVFSGPYERRCMKTYAIERVVGANRRYAGSYICVKRKIIPMKAFYVPYT